MIFDDVLEGFSKEQTPAGLGIDELAAKFRIGQKAGMGQGETDYAALAKAAYGEAQAVEGASDAAQESAIQANQVFSPKGPPVAPMGAVPPRSPTPVAQTGSQGAVSPAGTPPPPQPLSGERPEGEAPQGFFGPQMPRRMPQGGRGGY